MSAIDDPLFLAWLLDCAEHAVHTNAPFFDWFHTPNQQFVPDMLPRTLRFLRGLGFAQVDPMLYLFGTALVIGYRVVLPARLVIFCRHPECIGECKLVGSATTHIAGK